PSLPWNGHRDHEYDRRSDHDRGQRRASPTSVESGDERHGDEHGDQRRAASGQHESDQGRDHEEPTPSWTHAVGGRYPEEQQARSEEVRVVEPGWARNALDSIHQGLYERETQ